MPRLLEVNIELKKQILVKLMAYFFRKDAPGVDGGLVDNSMSFDKNSLFDLTSSFGYPLV